MFPVAHNRHHNTSQRWHTWDLGHVFPRTARSVARSVPTVNEEFRDCSLDCFDGGGHTHKSTQDNKLLPGLSATVKLSDPVTC